MDGGLLADARHWPHAEGADHSSRRFRHDSAADPVRAARLVAKAAASGLGGAADAGGVASLAHRHRPCQRGRVLYDSDRPQPARQGCPGPAVAWRAARLLSRALSADLLAELVVRGARCTFRLEAAARP